MLASLVLAGHTYLLRRLCATSMTVTYRGKPTVLHLEGKYAGVICTGYESVKVTDVSKVGISLKIIATDGPDDLGPTWSIDVDPVGDAP